VYDWELASLRASAQDVMPDLCDVYRRTGAGDAYGGGADFDGTPVADGVKVQVEPLAAGAFSEAVGAAGREVDSTSFELAFPHGTDVRMGDMIEVTSLGDVQIIIRQVEEPESWDVLVSAQGTLAQ
jgi:hypothetical protein